MRPDDGNAKRQFAYIMGAETQEVLGIGVRGATGGKFTVRGDVRLTYCALYCELVASFMHRRTLAG